PSLTLTPRSALVTMSVASPAVTPARFSSLATAELVTVWPGVDAPTLYGTLIVQVDPGGRLAGRLQWIALPIEPEQSPARSAPGLPTLRAPGTRSSRTRLSASDGPLLVIVMR